MANQERFDKIRQMAMETINASFIAGVVERRALASLHPVWLEGDAEVREAAIDAKANIYLNEAFFNELSDMLAYELLVREVRRLIASQNITPQTLSGRGVADDMEINDAGPLSL
jgi:hypothetical protein